MFDPTRDRPRHLITIPISHYCEKARWGLDRLSLSYVEQPHLLAYHRKATAAVGGTSVPVLVMGTEALTDSTDILRYLDTLAPDSTQLYPKDLSLREQVNTLEDWFNRDLGPETRRWGYFHLLDQDALLRQQWCRGIPQREQALFPKLLPQLRETVRQALNLSAESAEQALDQVHRIFAAVGDRLADGRPYLTGDQFTAADLTFAALAAPMIMPPKHPTYVSGLGHLPRSMAKEIAACRQCPAGKFVLRVYGDRPCPRTQPS